MKTHYLPISKLFIKTFNFLLLKKSYCFLLILFFYFNVNAQFTCEVDDPQNPEIIGYDPITIQYIPDEYTINKVIKINIHFMLKQNGPPLNFTETDDGNGNTNFTGYDLANEIISLANLRLQTNDQMNLPQGNNTPVLDRKYSLILKGIYFDRNDDDYSYQNTTLGGLLNDYGINIGNEVNLFFLYDQNVPYVGGGNANMAGYRGIRMRACWQTYVDNGTTGFWATAGTLIHELGHNLGLHHTVRWDNGPCGNIDDYCSDTPSRDDLINSGEPDPCCGWNMGHIPYCSNNMMDYSGHSAITPEQLGRVHYTIINEMLDYLEDNYCEIYPNSNPYVITNGSNIIWSNSRMFDNDIIVESGGSLIIQNCWVHMPIDSKIEVQRGGELTLINCTITNNCSGFWQGIKVLGDVSQSQYTPPGQQCAQGKLILNDAIIENAVIAVDVWNSDLHPKIYTGGIVYADNATFRNNATSLRFGRYRNYLPNDPSTELDNFSSFEDCTFEINNDYIDDVTFVKHAYLNGVKGIDFNACDFFVDSEIAGVSDYSQAIVSNGAGISVLPVCNSIYTPCADWDPCTFTGFYTAIEVMNDISSTYTPLVYMATFNDNIYGVKIEGVDNAIVLYSNFFIGENDVDVCPDAAGVGIYLESATGFALEENTFTKYPGAPTDNYIGISINNTNSSDEVYKNSFDNLSYANYSEGKNWLLDYTFLGLEYLCNQNTNNYADFFVGTDDYGTGGIQSSQGDDYHVTGNTFSQTGATWHFYNGGGYMIDYYWGIDENPDYYKLFNVHDIGAPIYSSCPSHYDDISPGDIILSSQEEQDAEQEYYSSLTGYNNVKTLYDNLVDGGNTDAEVIDIQTAQPQDMWALRAQLLGDSPHLSMEVLKEAADRTDVFTEAALFDILSANPDELKKEELLTYLEEKQDPLPSYMIDILRSVANGTTYKTTLQQQMARYNRGKIRAAHDMIRSNVHDTITDYTELRNWLDNLGGVSSDRQIIATYVKDNDFTSAYTLANMLPQLYQFDIDEMIEHSFFMEILTLHDTLYKQDRTIHQLDSTEIASLVFIADSSKGVARTYAKNILKTAYDYQFENCPCLEGTAGHKRSAVNMNAFNEVSGIDISVKPNPANQWAAFDYILPNNETKGTITIKDITGKTIEVIHVSGKQGQKLWDTRQTKQGVYIYVFESGGYSKSGKIVINK